MVLIRNFASHGVAIGLLLFFVMQSFPMMYPGFDIWWHLDVIRSVEYFDGQPYGRWHWIWNRILGFWGVDEFFSQALVIHRSQFAVCVLSLYTSTLLLVSAAFRGRLPKPTISAGLSALSVVCWLVMHGTSSRAPYLGQDSAVTMSWINWYSVSHQIALPLYVLAVSLMIHAVALDRYGYKVRLLELLLSLLLLVAVGLLHAAEVPYFLFMAGVGVVLYAARNKLTFAAIGGIFLLLVFGIVVGRLSHGESTLLMRMWDGDWAKIWSVAQRHGDLMIRGLNRAQTSWHILYTVFSLLLILLIAFSFVKEKVLDMRVLLWLIASVVLPASIHFKYSAGILAQVTYLTLAWRFSFGSMLFVVPSIYIGFAYILRADGYENRPLFRGVIFLGVLSMVVALFFGSLDVARKNIYSIVSSVDRERMHFGLSEVQFEQLSVLSEVIDGGGAQERSCFDLFTTYYLHYIFEVKNVCYPQRILEGATHLLSRPSAVAVGAEGVSGCDCSFLKNSAPGDYRKLIPAWNYQLLK